MNADKYLESIGLENVIDEEFFNNDDKSWYKVQELMESYHQAKLKLFMKTEIKTKQLEWENRFESTDEFGIKAQTPFCTYTIIDMKGTRFAKGIHLSGTDGVDVEVSSFDEGKKLAQADFERRIKECLITE